MHYLDKRKGNCFLCTLLTKGKETVYCVHYKQSERELFIVYIIDKGKETIFCAHYGQRKMELFILVTCSIWRFVDHLGST